MSKKENNDCDKLHTFYIILIKWWVFFIFYVIFHVSSYNEKILRNELFWKKSKNKNLKLYKFFIFWFSNAFLNFLTCVYYRELRKIQQMKSKNCIFIRLIILLLKFLIVSNIFVCVVCSAFESMSKFFL